MYLKKYSAVYNQFLIVHPHYPSPSEDDVTRYFRSGSKSSFNKVMWQFSDFFLKFTNQLTPNFPQKSIYIKSTLSPDMMSLATSGRLLVNTRYNASRPNIFQAVWCIVKKNLQAGRSYHFVKIFRYSDRKWRHYKNKNVKKTSSRRESNTHLRAWTANVLSIRLMLQRCLVVLTNYAIH